MKTIISTGLLLLYIPLLTAQQVNEDIVLIEKHIAEKGLDNHIGKKQKVLFSKSKNPATVISYFFLFIYQKAISEQISAVCEFEPTCSHFSIEVLKQFGFFKGVCLTTDRLTRCNGQAQTETEEFLINHNNGKVIDAALFYRFKN